MNGGFAGKIINKDAETGIAGVERGFFEHYIRKIGPVKFATIYYILLGKCDGGCHVLFNASGHNIHGVYV